METDEKRKARLEKMVATTQLRLTLETEEERRAKNGLDLILNLIWIEIGVLKIQGMSPARPVMGTIFLVLCTIRRGVATICI